MLWTAAQRSFPQLPASTESYFGLTRKLKQASDIILTDARRRADHLIRHRELAADAQRMLKDMIDGGTILYRLALGKIREYRPEFDKFDEETRQQLPRSAVSR